MKLLCLRGSLPPEKAPESRKNNDLDNFPNRLGKKVKLKGMLAAVPIAKERSDVCNTLKQEISKMS